VSFTRPHQHGDNSQIRQRAFTRTGIKDRHGVKLGHRQDHSSLSSWPSMGPGKLTAMRTTRSSWKKWVSGQTNSTKHRLNIVGFKIKRFNILSKDVE